MPKKGVSKVKINEYGVTVRRWRKKGSSSNTPIRARAGATVKRKKTGTGFEGYWGKGPNR